VPKPNFVFILADDLGYADLGCYGGRLDCSPVLDRMAAQGLRFTQGYANSSVCSPTRFALMTGRWQHRLRGGADEPIASARRGSSTLGLPPEHPTLPSLLAKAGYATALVGKWHLGWPPHFGPLKSGYQEFFGALSGGLDYFTHRDSSGAHDLWDGDRECPQAGYLTDLFSQKAVEFVKRARQPFLLSLHYTAPHWPWEGPGDTAASRRYRTVADSVKNRFVNGYADGGSPQVFAAMMQRLDEGVARLLGALEDTGQSRDTFVVFTSDNGGERYSYNRPGSEGKGSLHEGGIRVPAMVRWPGRVPAGRTTDKTVITMDWTATMLALGGASSDPRYPLDGIDLLPLCQGKPVQWDRTLFWRTLEEEAVRQGAWKYLRSGKDELLFEIPKDPGERIDLAAHQPKKLRQLREQFRQWNAQVLPRPAATPGR
jgi:arylsulfatase A-like enzyme